MKKLSMPSFGCYSYSKKYVAFLSLFFFTSFCFANSIAEHEMEPIRLDNYTQIKDALDAGLRVSLLIRLARCTVAGDTRKGPAIIGGAKIKSFIIPDDKFIAFTDSHETLDAKSNPIEELILYKINPDGGVMVRSAFALPGSNQAQTRGEYNCAINDSIEFTTY